MEDEAVPKRKRVTQACDNCRALKSKVREYVNEYHALDIQLTSQLCDGQHPICSRCKGYGYTCQWKGRNRKSTLSISTNFASNSNDPAFTLDEIATLRHAVQSAHEVLRGLHGKLELDDQRAVESVLTGTASSPNLASISSPLSQTSTPDLLASYPFRGSSTAAYRYLGEVSDVSFFNSVKQVLQRNASGGFEGLQHESYERGALDLADTVNDVSFKIPDRKTADGFVNIYFSTIHVAYPFICRQQFMIDYEQFWAGSTTSIATSGFNSLMLTIFAIGAHYSICAHSKQHCGVSVHQSYFRHAVVLYCQLGTELSIEICNCLLAQCFYLLASCQTCSCWTTLGIAIRTAQSIGLHVEEGRLQVSAKIGEIAQEFRRRTWYSLYVLDRLLALQLGRPSAIRNRDFNVKLPSRLDDGVFDLESDQMPESSPTDPKSGDYFIAVIRFSEIIGHVMRDLYRPSMIDYTEAMLSRTDRLDAELLNWKAHLPRWLRFDRGHTFEQSPTLKKQRNMLGIKFHHLRALIHRPYLCLPWLQRNDTNIKLLLDLHSRRVVLSENICVHEARETAHMLHDVTDKKTLVEDFPWWQMISCLICASSILLVMRAFESIPGDPVQDDGSRELLEEDADTCLKVFDALSTNSEAARLARDMLRHLREIKVQDQEVTHGDMWPRTQLRGKYSEGGIVEPRVAGTASPLDSDYVFRVPPELAAFDSNGQYLPTPALNWPSEIADSMAWSSQFVDTLDPAVLSWNCT